MTEQTQESVGSSATNLVTFNFRNPQANAIKANEVDGLPAPIKRAAVSVAVPLLTKEQIITILTGDNVSAIQLVVDQTNNILIDEVRAQLDELPNYEEVDVSKLDFSKVDFTTIANQPKATRSGGISDELWEDWATDMQTVFAAHTDRTEVQVTTIVTLLQKKLREVNKSEKVLKVLENYLSTWFTNTSEESQAKFVEIYKRLSARIESYLNTVNDDPLAAMGL